MLHTWQAAEGLGRGLGRDKDLCGWQTGDSNGWVEHRQLAQTQVEISPEMSRKQSFMVVWRVENYREHKHALKTMATAALNSANQLLAVTATVAVTHARRLRGAREPIGYSLGLPGLCVNRKPRGVNWKPRNHPVTWKLHPLTSREPDSAFGPAQAAPPPAAGCIRPCPLPGHSWPSMIPWQSHCWQEGWKGVAENRGGELSPGDPHGSQETQSSEEKWVDFFLCCPPTTLSGLPAPPSPSLPEDMVSSFGASQSGDPEYGECSAPVKLYSRNRRDEITKTSGNIISSYKKKKNHHCIAL